MVSLFLGPVIGSEGRFPTRVSIRGEIFGMRTNEVERIRMRCIGQSGVKRPLVCERAFNIWPLAELACGVGDQDPPSGVYGGLSLPRQILVTIF